MTLKDLCSYFRQYSDNEDKCEHYKNQYFVANHNNFHAEMLDEQDIVGLRPYQQCFALCIYEYLAAEYNHPVADWFSKYDFVSCSREDNDYFRGLREGYKFFHSGSDEGFDDLCTLILDKAIEPFKKRGIARPVFDDSV